MKRTDPKPFTVDGGIVIFEEFSGDWNRKAGCRLLENGWSHWYRGHSEVDGFRVDLLRLRAGKLDAFPIADALIEYIKSLPSEETNRLLAGLPEAIAARLQPLLDRQDAGQPLTPEERAEGEELVNLAEFLRLLQLRAERPTP